MSDKGNAYGTQYHTLLTLGNIKFVKKNSPSSETMMETMTSGRVYAIISKENYVKSIIYFDKEGKRSKQIDLTHQHQGLQPHTHHGYLHSENDSKTGASRLTTEEHKMVDRVLEQWQNYTS